MLISRILRNLCCSFSCSVKDDAGLRDDETSSPTSEPKFSPLPLIDWADNVEVWDEMVLKGVAYVRNPACLRWHPAIKPSMRSKRLIWISEVCQAYRFSRETFHLTIDFIDRFLASERSLSPNNFELACVTALYIATKLEEIAVVEIKDLTFVTEGDCSVADIKQMELTMLAVLEWKLRPVTAISWLSTFLQIVCLPHSSERRLNVTELTTPVFCRELFTSMTQLLDICTLQIESLRFPYNHLAASVLFLMTNEKATTVASNISVQELWPCINWMLPFFCTLSEVGFSRPIDFDGVPREGQHNIQPNCFDDSLFNRIMMKNKENKSKALE